MEPGGRGERSRVSRRPPATRRPGLGRGTAGCAARAWEARALLFARGRRLLGRGLKAWRKASREAHGARLARAAAEHAACASARAAAARAEAARERAALNEAPALSRDRTRNPTLP